MHDSTDADETRRIDLPESLAEWLERRITDTEFDSVDAYVAVALDSLLTEMEALEERTADESTTATRESATAADEATTATGDATAERDPDADGRAVGDGSADEDETTQPSGSVEDRLDSLGYL